MSRWLWHKHIKDGDQASSYAETLKPLTFSTHRPAVPYVAADHEIRLRW